MTPLIDVIFLLLIFFVCTAGFDVPEELLPADLSLPGASNEIVNVQKEGIDFPPVHIRISVEQGLTVWRVEGRQSDSPAGLLEILRSLSVTKNDIPVIIDSEGDVPIENVLDAYDASRAVGLQKIQFAAKKPG